jgi:SAM-dependent methyltransferase
MKAESSIGNPEFLSAEGARAALARLPALKTSLDEFEPWDNIPWESQAEQLLRCRFDVVGIDIAAPVVEQAQADAEASSLPCRYHVMSFLEMTFEATFGGAFLANSTLNQLGERELAEFLGRVRRALVPAGRFVCEVYVSPEARGSDEVRTTRRLLSLPYSPWSAEPHHWLERTSTFPAERQRVTHHVIMAADGSLREHWSRSRLYTFDEMTAQLRQARLDVQGWFDQDLRSPVGPDTECAWVVADARGDDR